MKANMFAAQLAFAALVIGGSAQAQQPPRTHGTAGTLGGIALGIALGFGVASAIDYDLEEGGAIAAIAGGAALGALIGQKTGASLGRPWTASAPFEIGFGLGAGASPAGSDVRGAIARAGFPPRERHHRWVPFGSVAYRTTPKVTIGLEASGVRGNDVHGVLDDVHLTETVGGRIVSLVARVGAAPTERDWVVVGVGGGIDAYRIDVESYFDPQRILVDSSSRRMHYVPWGAQANGDIRFYVVPNVAIRVYAAAHVVSPVRTKPIAFGEEHFLPSHKIGMSWAVAGIAFALHY